MTIWQDFANLRQQKWTQDHTNSWLQLFKMPGALCRFGMRCVVTSQPAFSRNPLLFTCVQFCVTDFRKVSKSKFAGSNNEKTNLSEIQEWLYNRTNRKATTQIIQVISRKLDELCVGGASPINHSITNQSWAMVCQLLHAKWVGCHEFIRLADFKLMLGGRIAQILN